MITAEKSSTGETIEAAACKLAARNVEAAPETEAIYFFPHPEESRLIETDPVTLSDAEIVPYHFGPSPKSGIPFPSLAALIRPEEAFHLPPPRG